MQRQHMLQKVSQQAYQDRREQGRTNDFGKGLEAQFLGLGSANKDDGTGSVVQVGSIRGGNDAITLEDRPELWDLACVDLLVLFILFDDGFSLSPRVSEWLDR